MIKTNLIDISHGVPVKNYYSPQHWLHDTDWFIVTCVVLIAMTVVGKSQLNNLFSKK